MNHNTYIDLLLESDSTEYDPPLKDIPMHLKKDAVHSWRADTGIELIHREPSKKELERIIKNWKLMPEKLKTISDKKSIELFGMDNMTHAKKLIPSYAEEEI